MGWPYGFSPGNECVIASGSNKCVRCVRTPCGNVNFVVHEFSNLRVKTSSSHHPEISGVVETQAAGQSS